jgi:hypothetical protein
MKRIVTRLLYVFSFSLLFTALYLNLVQLNKDEAAVAHTANKAVLTAASLSQNSAVAQPENNTHLK